MNWKEILLNLAIGTCGSLIAAAIYSHLQKTHLEKIYKEFIRSIKTVERGPPLPKAMARSVLLVFIIMMLLEIMPLITAYSIQ